MKKSTLVIIVLIIVAVLWGMGAYNGFVAQQEEATTALANVEAAYQRRADMLPQLAKTVKAYAQHEKETFEEVTKARTQAAQIHLDADDLTPEKIKQFEQVQGELQQALSKLIAVAEAYPELKASENFKALQDQIEGTENRINEARRNYNTAVQGYNQAIRTMPKGLIANITGFKTMSKFEAAAGAEKAPDLDL